MYNPFLFGDTPLEIANHFDSEDYVYDIELNPIKGIFKPEIQQKQYEFALILPPEYYHSIVTSYQLHKHHHLFDGYQFYISYHENLCFITIPTISRNHTNCFVSKLHEYISFRKVVTIEWNDQIKTIQQMYHNKSNSIEINNEFEQMKLPNALNTINASFFTFCVFNQMDCVSIHCPPIRKQVEDIIVYLRKVTGLEKIQLPNTSFSLSNLYA